MYKKRIYIADDERNICNIIKSFLVKEGFEVDIFDNGIHLLAAFDITHPDLLVLDIMMPGMDGYTVCSEIRKKSAVPIIFVSARDTERDKITGLTLGGDDYLTKPFSPIELVARIKSIFRRIEMDQQFNKIDLSQKELGDVILLPGTKQALVNGKDISLTGMEFALLLYLFENSMRAVSRSELLDKIWGFENEVETRATDDMIKRIRKKLSEAGSQLKIETVWGFGFKILLNKG